MRGATRVREGAEALKALRLAPLLLALGACRRALVEPRGEIAGAWLHQPERASGFELRADGTLGLLNRPELSGLAWNLSHGELVLSLNDAAHVESHVVRMAVARLDADALELAGDDARFAGAYARGRAEPVRGVLTYRERIALPPDAHAEVELSRAGVGLVALAVFAPRGEVPIGFELSVLASETARYTLLARISDRERTLWLTPDPVEIAAGGEVDSEPVLLRAAR